MSLTSPRFSDNQRLNDAAENNPWMGSGEKGEGVRLIQQALIDLGYRLPLSTRRYGSPDGIYGRETKVAVRDFQKSQGLGKDGVVGRNTMRRLDKLLPLAGKQLPPLPAGTKVKQIFNVPMVRQHRSPICWIACVAMIKSFKEHRSVTVSELTGGFDPSNSTIANPASTWPKFYAQLDAFGFTSEGPRISPGPQYLVNLLRTHGPFILTHYTKTLAPAVTGMGTHAVVLTGLDMYKDQAYFNNPWGKRNDVTSISTILGSMERLWNQQIRSVAYMDK